jgi:hypothetical protein
MAQLAVVTGQYDNNKPGPQTLTAALWLLQEALAEHAERTGVEVQLQVMPTRSSAGGMVQTVVATWPNGRSFFYDVEGERP